MVLTLDGIDICCSDEHPLKALLSIVVIDFGSEIFFKFEHPLNAPSFRVIIDELITIF